MDILLSLNHKSHAPLGIVTFPSVMNLAEAFDPNARRRRSALQCGDKDKIDSSIAFYILSTSYFNSLEWSGCVVRSLSLLPFH